MSRTFIIGDVHGCVAELEALVDALAPVGGDRFAFLGDLVDRGPDSLGVVARVRDLLERFPGSVAIAGNHEERAIRRRGEPQPGSTWAEQADSATWGFLESLPVVAFLADFDAVLVHGGFYPAFAHQHPEGLGDLPTSGWHRGGGRRLERVRRFLRVRQVSPSGDMVGLGHEDASSRPWADVYAGTYGFAFYGHEPRASVHRSAHALGLDTGCVFGGCLTAAVLEGGQHPREARIVAVPAQRAYAPWYAGHGA